MSRETNAWPPGASMETFAANVRALATAQPELAVRLGWPAGGDHVTAEPDGRVTYLRNRTRFDLSPEPGSYEVAVRAALAGRGEDGRVLVAGIGLGEPVLALLREPDVRVVAWDRDPWLLRTFLAREDVSAELASGRLRLALGSDLDELRDDPTLEASVDHPLLARVYARELEAFRGPSGRERVLVCDGGLYVDSLGESLTAEGYEVWTVDVARTSEEELDRTAERLAPALVVSVNYREGLAEFCHRHGCALLVWEIDPFTHEPRAPHVPTDHVRVFTYRRPAVETFGARGFEHVEYLPLAADTRLRRPVELTDDERARFAAPVSFVGSSLVANLEPFSAALAESFSRWQAETGVALADANPLEVVVDAQRERLDEWLVPELLERHAPGFAAWSRLHTPDRDPAQLLGEVAASERRLSYVASLAEAGIEVWGDEGWRAVEPYGVRYRGPATHGSDVTRIYGSATINLDVGRIYQNDIVTLRVFDVLACGGFALVEHNAALEELFEVGVELESFRSLAECLDKVRYYLEHPDAARRIAERGLDAVRERHSFEERVNHMLGTLADLGRARGLAS